MSKVVNEVTDYFSLTDQKAGRDPELSPGNSTHSCNKAIDLIDTSCPRLKYTNAEEILLLLLIIQPTTLRLLYR